MKYLFYTLILLCCFYLIGIFVFCLIDRKKRIVFDNTLLSKDSMTVFKGFAILIIMLAHIGNGFGIRYLTPLGSLGVAIFLFCSGFGLEKSFEKNGLKGFWKKRIITAYFPYGIFEIFGYFFLYENIGFRAIIFDLLLIDPLHPFGWYMQCLFLYYIAFFVASLLENKMPMRKYLCLAICAVSMFIFMRGLFKQQMLSFVFGVASVRLMPVWEKHIKKKLIGIAFFLMGCMALAVKQFDFVRNGSEVIFYLIEVVQCTALALSVILLLSNILPRLKSYFYEIFVQLGKISFELYLIHGIFLPKTVHFWNIPLFFVLSIVVSSAIYIIKIHFKLLLKRKQ